MTLRIMRNLITQLKSKKDRITDPKIKEQIQKKIDALEGQKPIEK